jgi:UDP-N-acetylglucosamine 2-epimerase (non-hydrolysing)
LAAFYRRIQIGHVEAGLRTADKWQPSRKRSTAAGALSPTCTLPLPSNPPEPAAEYPRRNRARHRQPVIDALQTVAALPPPPKLPPSSKIGRPTPSDHPSSLWGRRGEGPRLRSSPLTAANFGQPLENICAALALAETYGDALRIVYPVHLNPNVQEPVYRLLRRHSQPVPAAAAGLLAARAPDEAPPGADRSGGLQEEAPGLGVPVLVMRAVTERPEGVQAGTVRLVGADRQRIVSETRRLLDDPAAHAAMAQAINPYGDGKAAGRIVQAILDYRPCN